MEVQVSKSTSLQCYVDRHLLSNSSSTSDRFAQPKSTGAQTSNQCFAPHDQSKSQHVDGDKNSSPSLVPSWDTDKRCCKRSFTDTDWRKGHGKRRFLGASGANTIPTELRKEIPISHSTRLGTLGMLPPELRDAIYDLVLPDSPPEIGSACLPWNLRSVSSELRGDLDRRRYWYCTHTAYTLTCDEESIKNNPHEWIRSRMQPMHPRPTHYHSVSHKKMVVHDLRVAVTLGKRLPTLLYHIPLGHRFGRRSSVWDLYLSGANIEQQRHQREELRKSYEVAAAVILAARDIFIKGSTFTGTKPMKFAKNCHRLANILECFALIGEDGKSTPLGVLGCEKFPTVEGRGIETSLEGPIPLKFQSTDGDDGGDLKLNACLAGPVNQWWRKLTRARWS